MLRQARQRNRGGPGRRIDGCKSARYNAENAARERAKTRYCHINSPGLSTDGLELVAFICPYCGLGGDATPNLDDIAQWYATHHPHLPVDSIVPIACAGCTHGYARGDKVVLRNEVGGDVLTVIALVASPGNPDVVTVRYPNGHENTFTKSQIQPYAEAPNVAERSLANPDGFF